MKLPFRIECPHCNWGHEWRNDYVNQGWLKMRCSHCEETFVTKIIVNLVDVEVKKELVGDVPCMTLPEAK